LTEDGLLVDIYFCDSCNFYQIPETVNVDYYDGYNVSAADFHTQLMYEDRNRQLSLLKKHAKSAISDSLLIDIGSSSGVFLEEAKKIFPNVVGIEPSIAACKLMKEKNIPCINGYFSRNMFEAESVDVFYSSQVFEHLSDPLSCLKDVYHVCKKGAVGILEVPDGQKIWQDKIFYSIWGEHINYFSPLSLNLLASRAGFLVDYCNAFDGKNIEILLRKPGDETESFSKKQNEIITLISGLPKNKIISAFGAGLNAKKLMILLEKHVTVKNLYDNNPGIQGKYIAGCNTAIRAPDKANIQRDDIILLFNTKFDREITNELYNKYEFRGEVINLK
jgi:SAM-dependent methyltransferase